MAEMPIVDLTDNESTPPSTYGQTAINLLEFTHPRDTAEVIEVAKAYALLDLADAIRNS
jgi:hypothetical protein